MMYASMLLAEADVAVLDTGRCAMSDVLPRSPHATRGTMKALAIAADGPDDRFLSHVHSTSKKYRKKAKKAHRQYIRVGLSTLAFSSLLPVAAATSVPRWVLAALGGVVITGHGFLALTRPHEREIHYERAGNTLALEIRKYQYCSGSNNDQAWHHFVTRVLALESGFLRQEIGIEQLAELPPQDTSPADSKGPRGTVAG
jgi:hypothetical protein